jgi:hypothetical protein
MKPILALLTTRLLAPLAAFGQAKHEAANATKSAKRAWESAPAEKKALWQQQRDALIHINLSDDTYAPGQLHLPLISRRRQRCRHAMPSPRGTTAAPLTFASFWYASGKAVCLKSSLPATRDSASAPSSGI